jgi:hypothetical protein
VESKAERAGEAAGKRAKWQAGNFDPGMEASKGAAVAGERKAVASRRFGLREQSAARREVSIPRLEKTATAERTVESSGALKRGVQCRS